MYHNYLGQEDGSFGSLSAISHSISAERQVLARDVSRLGPASADDRGRKEGKVVMQKEHDHRGQLVPSHKHSLKHSLSRFNHTCRSFLVDDHCPPEAQAFPDSPSRATKKLRHILTYQYADIVL